MEREFLNTYEISLHGCQICLPSLYYQPHNTTHQIHNTTDRKWQLSKRRKSTFRCCRYGYSVGVTAYRAIAASRTSRSDGNFRKANSIINRVTVILSNWETIFIISSISLPTMRFVLDNVCVIVKDKDSEEFIVNTCAH
ncbi:hypothetical protein L9F63_004535, partial [Diploptera punctata]